MPGARAWTAMVSAVTVPSVLKDPQGSIRILDGNKSRENESSGQWLEGGRWTHTWRRLWCIQEAVLRGFTAKEQGFQSEFSSSPCPQVERNPRTTRGTSSRGPTTLLNMTSPDPQSTLRPLYFPQEAGGWAAGPKSFVSCEHPGGVDSHGNGTLFLRA